MKQPIIIGITGGIGSGKTTVANYLRNKGFRVYDSDKEARRLQNEHPVIRQKICELLGSEAYIGTELNRPFVAGQVFSDISKLQKLNDIVHPIVKDDFVNWIKANSEQSLLFQESAILFESGFNQMMDKIILVTATENIRVERVMKRDGISEKQVLSRIKNQHDETEKEKLSDFVLRTDDDIPLEIKIDVILKKLVDKNA